MSEWHEDLPEECPEADAKAPAGEVFYRLVVGEKIKCEDFWSHRKTWPHKAFKTTECRARAVSVFGNIADCQNLLRLPPHSGKNIVEISLSNDSGVIKKTFKDSHYSWWRSRTFDPVANSKLITSAIGHA